MTSNNNPNQQNQQKGKGKKGKQATKGQSTQAETTHKRLDMQESKDINAKIDKLDAEIDKVDNEIYKVNIEIDEIKAKIDGEERKDKVDRDAVSLKEWKCEKEHLRCKERDLRCKERDLRCEKRDLRRKELLLLRRVESLSIVPPSKRRRTNANDMYPGYNDQMTDTENTFFTFYGPKILLTEIVTPSKADCSKIPLSKTDTPSKAFIRACYKDFLEIIFEKMKEGRFSIVVTGNPGIGKSMFYCYCILRVLQDTSVLNKNTLVINCRDIYRKLVVDGKNHWFEDVQAADVEFDIDVIRFIDGMSDRTVGWAGSTILFSSPDAKNQADKLVKYSSSFTAKTMAYLHMPCWELKELQDAAKYIGFKENVRERFSIVGGIARDVFGEDTLTQLKLDLESSISLLTGKEASLVRFIDTKAMKSDDYTHKVFRMVPHEKGLGMEYGFNLDFRSNWIANEAAETMGPAAFEELVQYAINHIYDINSSCLVGKIYELRIHRRFSNNNFSTLHCLPLGKGSEITIKVLPTRKEPHSEFNKLADITLEKDSPQYCVPRGRCFPGLDSFYWDGTNCYILQITIAEKHDIKNHALVTFKAWYRQLGVGGQCYFVFVVPNKKFNVWKENGSQKLVGVGNRKLLSDEKKVKICQYVAKLDFTDV